MEGCMGLTTDTLLVGRLDGSVAMIDIVDSSSFRRSELQHCSRKDGSCFLYAVKDTTKKSIIA